MRSIGELRWTLLRHAVYGTALLAAPILLAPVAVVAQTCTSQAKMTPVQRNDVAAATLRLANAVVSGDSNAVQAATIPQYATNFAQTAYLIRTTSSQLAGNALTLSQAYLLDASNRTANETAEANFSCPLTGTAAETDFAIAGLPPGRYAFTMAEASGPNPFLLSFLLQADASGSGWKMAGFYPHRRDVAGHNGVWYWDAARSDAKAGKIWLAWVLYGEADQLLRPANFVSSTNLDRLRSELRTATPPTLSDGLSAATPLALSGANGAEFRITELRSEASDDGKHLNLIVHLRADPASGSGTDAATTRNLAAASALLSAHPDLRSGFDQIWVVADNTGADPFVTERPMSEIAASK
ncbi:MAG: hypothetical protein ACRYFU_13695 [Janthinobacterium lividum]